MLYIFFIKGEIQFRDLAHCRDLKRYTIQLTDNEKIIPVQHFF
ncbi:hypothetical protein SD78_3448 [Bacillus badius]|nr:hypothetical protein SD78_3448 [Bacillus badius]